MIADAAAGRLDLPGHAAGHAEVLQGAQCAIQAQRLGGLRIDDAGVLDAGIQTELFAEAAAHERLEREVARVARVRVLGIPPLATSASAAQMTGGASSALRPCDAD